MDRWLIAAITLAVVFGAWWGSRRAREARHAPDRVDPRDFGLDGPGSGTAAVLFGGPYCLGCQAWERELDRTGTPYVRVDVKERPDLARRYHVRHTPLVLAVRRDSGEVAAAYDSDPSPGDVSHVSALVAA